MVVRKSAVICQRVGASARAVVDTIAGRVLAAARCLAFDIINLILIVELEIGMLELPRVIAVEGRGIARVGADLVEIVLVQLTHKTGKIGVLEVTR